jgi:hypothetical protein
MGASLTENDMAATNQVDKTRMMGTDAFKKEINHLLHSNSHTNSEGELDPGWNCRDHALVMALLLKSGEIYPKVASGKVMFVQGPVAGNPAFHIGQEEFHKSGHNWLVHAKFGLIDVSPTLQSKEHSFRDSFNGVFNRVWLPQDKERNSVVMCQTPEEYVAKIERAERALGHATAIYLHLDEVEVTANLFKTPFKFLHSQFSAEIKSRFGPRFYFAVAKHLRAFMMGENDSLLHVERLQAWGQVVDEYSN